MASIQIARQSFNEVQSRVDPADQIHAASGDGSPPAPTKMAVMDRLNWGSL